MDSVFDIYDIDQYTQNTLRKQTLKFLSLCYCCIVIRTLMSVSGVYFEYIGLCHKYQIPNQFVCRLILYFYVFFLFFFFLSFSVPRVRFLIINNNSKTRQGLIYDPAALGTIMVRLYPVSHVFHWPG